MEKNRFFVFCFSFIPGAGHMYLGMMKKGLILMSLFMADVFLSWVLYIDALLVVLPPIFFYAFFDTHNWKRSPVEVRREEDHRFALALGSFFSSAKLPRFENRNRLVGTACILVGVYLLYERVFMPVISQFCGQWGFWFVYDFLRNIPLMVVAILIVIFGIHLFRGSAVPMRKEMEFIEYKGEEAPHDGEKE